MTDELHFSEMSCLATCEQKWSYTYGLDQDEEEQETSRPLVLGSLLHAGATEWWDTPGGWDHVDQGKVLSHLADDARAGLTEEIATDFHWLMQRYDEVYQPTHDEWEVVADEIELDGIIAGVPIGGRADRIVLHLPTERLYLMETKSMKDWRRLDILTVDPQITHYWTLARQNGYEVDGILYDAIKTYRWKTGKHPASESFQRLFLDRNEEHAMAAGDQVRAVSDRRKQLAIGDAVPIRNISQMTCSWCWKRERCWEDLAFPETQIELVAE